MATRTLVSRRASEQGFWLGVYTVIVVGYLLWGHWLYSTYRVPVGNTGLYAEGLAQIAQGHWGGYVSFIGTTLGADAGEFIAYLVAPVYAIFHMAGLWGIWGLAVAATVALANRLLGDLAPLRTRIIVAILIVGNPFLLANFLTSWDFDILFLPGVLLLALLVRERRPYGVLIGAAVLTALIKDEAGILLGLWGLVEGLAFAQRRRALVVSAAGFGTYALTTLLIHHLWPTTPSQIGLHYAAIGGAQGVEGIIHFALHHPGVLLAVLAHHADYGLALMGGSGGAVLLSLSGLMVGIGGALNALGSGPLGALMAQPNFEFTLMVLPFMFLAAIDGLRRFPRMGLVVLVVWGLYTGVYGLHQLPSLKTPALPEAQLSAWHRLEAWYNQTPTPPVIYTANMAAAHFLRGPAVGVGVDSLHQIAALAAQDHRPLWLVYDPALGNDGAPRRWPKRLAALAYDRVLVPVHVWNHGPLHVYRLKLTTFLHDASTVTPPDVTIMPWLWNDGALTLDLPPGTYRVTGHLTQATGAGWHSPLLVVPPAPYLAPVTLAGQGTVVLQHIAP